MKKEIKYQKELIKKIEDMFPGCIVMKNDPMYMQGIPDLLILFENKWAVLEIKISEKSNIQPNQKHYIGMFNEMSFASFITPESEEDVLSDLQHAFGVTRETRVSQSK